MVNIKMPMKECVDVVEDKTTNNGEKLNTWKQWLGQRLEAGLRSMDLIHLKLDPQDCGIGDKHFCTICPLSAFYSFVLVWR